MNSTQRPDTVTAVDAALRRDADFRGINKDGEVYYLLGMCEARLARANAEIARLERINERLERELDAVAGGGDHRE